MIIGITGTIGAGKGTIVEYLVTNKGFSHYSIRAFLTQEIERRGMPVNRDSMVVVGNELRAAHGTAYLAEQLYDRAAAAGGNAIIESIRHPDEARALQAKGPFKLWSVDADQRLRYDRIRKRGSATDNISWETFQENENREMRSSDPHAQNIATVMDRANAHIENNGTFDELYAKVENLVAELK